jgi:hypothetical protein
MKIKRKVWWNEITRDFEVEFILTLDNEVLPSNFTVNLTAGYIAIKRELSKDGEIYKGITTYSEESINWIEDDTLRIIEAVKKEIRKARENRNKAKSLTMEFNFEID